jgi:hypothetical protein
MKNQEITVFYKWTANAGQFETLKSIYDQVFQQMKEHEPDAMMMQYFTDEEQNAVIVHDVFKDGAALGNHLGGTAATHFPDLVKIAVPGPFFFCGDVPDELRQAVIGMKMGAEFSSRISGFERS